MGNIYAVINQKGGVGKTTSVANIGAAITKLGKKVLMIDMDPQGNLGSHYGIDIDEAEDTYSMFDVLCRDLSLKDLIIKIDENLHLAPSGIYLSGAEIELAGAIARERKLKKAIDVVSADYDFIFIDCPPSLGVLTLNALVAANGTIIPVQSEYLSLNGVDQLLSTIGTVREDLNEKLIVMGAFVTMYDSKRILDRTVLEALKGYFGDVLFKTIIRKTVRLSEAPAQHTTVFSIEPKSNGAEDYMALAEEIINRDVLTVPQWDSKAGNY